MDIANIILQNKTLLSRKNIYWIICASLLIVVFEVCQTFGKNHKILVPQQYPTIQEAVNQSSDGDVIVVSAGFYSENIKITKKVTLIGSGMESTILTCQDGIVVTISYTVTMAELCVKGGETGIYAKKGSKLTIHHCRISDNKSDGIGFDNSFSTVLICFKNKILRNGDGIDMEHTQGILWENDFSYNRDDGLDIDGDAGAVILDNTFFYNGDDGIEIRLASITQAVIGNNTFMGNGEDGLEMINVRKKGEYSNYVAIYNNSFFNNKRFGIGSVRNDDEEAVDTRLDVTLYWGENTFNENGKGDVSPNYSAEELSRRRRPKTAEFSIQTLSESGKTFQSQIPIETPRLVGIIDVKPSINGTIFKDLEGIASYGDYLFIGDDNSREIFTVNRFTARVDSRVSTEPFPDTKITLRGPEGFSLTKIETKDVLAISDDEGGYIHYFQFNPPFIEKIIKSKDINSIAADPEGIEFIGPNLYFLFGGNNIILIDNDNLKKHPEFPKSISFKNLANHIAGIGKYKNSLLFTAAGYGGKVRHNGKSILFAADYKITKILKVWDIAPYTNDPRGITEADGLVYVVDGMAHGKDTDTGLLNKEGLKILIFDLETERDIKEFFNKLPIRVR